MAGAVEPEQGRARPYGGVATYGDLARELGVRDSAALVPGERTVTAAQKVGWAIGATPTPIVLPCHRVIGADGSLGLSLGLRCGVPRVYCVFSICRASEEPDEKEQRHG